METSEYTETFAGFILECRSQYEGLCAKIDSGEVPANASVTIEIKIPAKTVNQIRFDRLVVLAEDDDG